MTIPDNDFGARVRRRLADERVVWLTTTSADGTPQPNPVWFVPAGADAVLVYNDRNAVRLEHVAVRPRVSLSFDSDGQGGDIVVVAGVATQALDAPAADENADYVAKYGEAMAQISGDRAAFAQRYAVPLRIEFTKVRGH